MVIRKFSITIGILILFVSVLFGYWILFEYDPDWRIPCTPIPIYDESTRPEPSRFGKWIISLRKELGISVRSQICPLMCLAGDTLIDTPQGKMVIKDLREGVMVWTMDKSGQRVAMPIFGTSRIDLKKSQKILHITLHDGRELSVSPGHPTADGRLFSEIETGDILDGGRVVNISWIIPENNKTYDILPAGETGIYWANGVLVGSTLKN